MRTHFVQAGRGKWSQNCVSRKRNVLFVWKLSFGILRVLLPILLAPNETGSVGSKTQGLGFERILHVPQPVDEPTKIGMLRFVSSTLNSHVIDIPT